jgi:hypothetical protein
MGHNQGATAPSPEQPTVPTTRRKLPPTEVIEQQLITNCNSTAAQTDKAVPPVGKEKEEPL